MASKALLVGINGYPGAPLAGCVNDVNDLAEFLVAKSYFLSDEIRIITDARATAAAIRERLEWLTLDVRPGDRVFFGFSGHGTQVATRNADDEVDGLDEVICPVDFDWTDERMLRDKELASIFATRLPVGTRFGWNSDSCHSGDLTRGMFTPMTMDENGDGITGRRSYPMEAGMAWRLRVARDKGMPARILAEKHIDREYLNVGFLSGCRSDQTSADARINGRPCGAMTHYFLKAMRQHPHTSLSYIAEVMRGELAANGYSQQPVAEGRRVDLPFLG